jgi:hypothetical protein
MKKNIIWLLLFISVLVLVLPGCSGTRRSDNPNNDNPSSNKRSESSAPGSNEITARTIVHVTSAISIDTTWVNTNLYVIDTSISVSAKLTINAGTIVKFKPIYGSLWTTGSGTISAGGISTSHIIFTSLNDDTKGGDTNANGSATKPATGDWSRITVSNNANNSFSYCDFYYGGKLDTMLLVNYDATASIANCTFAFSKYSGLTITGGNAASTVTGNIFYNTTKPLLVNSSIAIDNTNMFHNPLNVAQVNAFNGIWVKGAVNTTIPWGETEVPFVLDNVVTVNGTLTLQPGVIIKFFPGTRIDIGVTGAVVAVGTSAKHITFTSYKDDTKKGDTNQDGSTTVPAKGDWTRISVPTGDSSFSYCDFFYGGGGNYEDDTMLLIHNASTPPLVSITNCTFAYSKHSGLNISGGNAASTVTGNIFYNNNKPLWVNSNITINNSNMFHNPLNVAQVNAYNGIRVQGSVSASVSASWGATEVPFVLDNVVTVSGTLTLQPGVVLKFFPGTRIDIGGTGTVVAVGTSVKHITFTSYKDDTKKGDTNKDGSTTVPAKGDWGSVSVGSTKSNEFTYCDFLYGGGSGSYDDSAIMTVPNNSYAKIDYCTFAYSLHAALNIQGAGKTTTVTNNAFYATTKPLWMDPDFSIDNSNIFHNPAVPTQKNKQNGIWLQTSCTISADRTWGETEVPFVADFEGFVIDDYVTLTIASSAVLKFSTIFCGINISTGASIANFANVIFTSVKDDAHGGDTDGVVATPANGDWEGINDGSSFPTFWRTDGNILYDTY